MLQKKFQSMMDEVAGSLLEREQAAYLCVLAVISQENLLFLGEPGVAKSKLIRSMCEHIDGAGYFQYLLTQFTEPNELFGPIDLIKYSDQGVYTRISDGMLTQAHLGFLDETFKANSAILNSLLTLVNERVYMEGGHTVDVPLISLFGASNETPKKEDGLDALYDRFLIKYEVTSVVADQSFESLITGDFRSLPVTTKVTLKDIQRANKEIYTVKISPEAVQAIKTLRTKLDKEGIKPSDRKWVQISKLVRAVAWLGGRTEVDVEDLEVLAHAVWFRYTEAKTAAKLVFEVSNPLTVDAIDYEDRAREVYEKMPTDDVSDFMSKMENVLQQLVDIYHDLGTKAENSKSRNKSRAREAMERIEGWHREASEKALRKSAKLALSLCD